MKKKKNRKMSEAEINVNLQMSPRTPSPSPSSPPSQLLSVTPEIFTRYSPNLVRRMQAETCYRCHHKGHWSWDCPLNSPNTKSLSPSTPNHDSISPIDILCRCGHGVCQVKTARNTRNCGKKYYACPVKRGKKCRDFIKWCDAKNIDENDLRPPPYKYPECQCGAGVCAKVNATESSGLVKSYFVCPVREGHGSCGYRVWEDELPKSNDFGEDFQHDKTNNDIEKEDVAPSAAPSKAIDTITTIPSTFGTITAPNTETTCTISTTVEVPATSSTNPEVLASSNPFSILDDILSEDSSVTVKTAATDTITSSEPDIDVLLQTLEDFITRSYEELGRDPVSQKHILQVLEQLNSLVHHLPENLKVFTFDAPTFFKESLEECSSLMHHITLHETNLNIKQQSIERANEGKDKWAKLEAKIATKCQSLTSLDDQITQLQAQLKELQEVHVGLKTDLDSLFAERERMKIEAEVVLDDVKAAVAAVCTSQVKYNAAKSKKEANEATLAKFRRLLMERSPFS